MQGVRDQRWNLERFIVFQTLILQRARHITASHAIRRRIAKWLEAWGLGSCEEYLTSARREETAEHQDQTYHSLVLHGKLRSAVRWITER